MDTALVAKSSDRFSPSPLGSWCVEVENVSAQDGLEYYVDLTSEWTEHFRARRPRDRHRVKSAINKATPHRRCSRAHRARNHSSVSGDRGSARYRSRTIRTRHSKSFSCTRNSPRELNQTGMRLGLAGKNWRARRYEFAAVDIKQGARRSRERLGWRVCDERVAPVTECVGRAGARMNLFPCRPQRLPIRPLFALAPRRNRSMRAPSTC